MARRVQRAERGASLVEYGAVLVLVGAIILGVFGTGLPGQVAGLISDSVECVGSLGDCEAGDSAEPGSENGPEAARGNEPDAENTPQTARGNEPVQAPDLPEPRESESDPRDRCIQAGSEPYCSPTSSNPKPAPSTPAPWEVHTWWNELSKEERAAVIREKPNQIRNLDGIPSDVRDDLNRTFLDTEVNRMLKEEGLTLQQVRTRGDEEVGSEELRALVDLQHVMENGKGGADGVQYDGAEYFLLSLDTDLGQVAVSHGNPDTADNVSTHVPGTGSGLTKVPSELNRADGLYQAAVAQDSEAEHASITWIGYDTPETVEAAGTAKAEHGRQALVDFQNGLRLTGDYSQNHTVVGHSYGSTLLGYAVQDDHTIPADNLVFVGSPGVGHDSVDDMDFNGNVHATISDSDWLTEWWVPDAIHGPDPTSAEFGAHTFASGEGTEHPQYFDDPHSPQGKYMGQVIAGQR